MKNEITLLLIGASIALVSSLFVQIVIYRLEVAREKRNQRKNTLLERIKRIEDCATSLIRSILGIQEFFIEWLDPSFRKDPKSGYLGKSLQTGLDFIPGMAAVNSFENEKISGLIDELRKTYLHLISFIVTLNDKTLQKNKDRLPRMIEIMLISKNPKNLNLEKLVKDQTHPSSEELQFMFDDFLEKNKDKLEGAYKVYNELMTELDKIKSNL